MCMHLAMVIAVGLTLSSMFTLSVASFGSFVLYMIAYGSSLFNSFTLDDDLNIFSAVMMKISSFIRTGLESPSVVKPLAHGIEISGTNSGMSVSKSMGQLILSPVKVISESTYDALIYFNWDLYSGQFLYLLIIMGLGIYVLKRKELDRVH